MGGKVTEESKRLADNPPNPIPKWYKWGPYVAERAWGTVREDYSENGDAWGYFPFEKSHTKTYRWGEDGIAGWCDRYQILCFAPAFWNEKDPFLKERLFGLASMQGNHGEDVKECYYHLDATPTHSYMKYLYKYPQEKFPYQQLIDENAKLSTQDPEYELTDTGIFANNRYFDISIEYAKASPEDLCIRIEAFNRSKEAAPLHIVPQLWFRNQWSWGDEPLPKPNISKEETSPDYLCLVADDTELPSLENLPFDYHLGKRYFYGIEGGQVLFTNNEDTSSNNPYGKEGFHKAIIEKAASTNPKEEGSKACIHYFFQSIPPESSAVLYLRLRDKPLEKPFEHIDDIIIKRREEADEFYKTIHSPTATAEENLIQRRALAGMLWSKQFYFYDVSLWMKGDSQKHPSSEARYTLRNQHWKHLNSMRVLSMPDKWEYPWFAAWDTAFHCLSLALVDIEFAKEQIWLFLFDQFQHPNGAIPAYEWEFSDLNPPVQAWAALQIFQMEAKKTGRKNYTFLKKCFLKLLVNFTFWVNKVDSSGCNVFEGGFLGLDNISLIDRSEELTEAGMLKQSDGTGWMAMFCLNLMRISLKLAEEEHAYEAMATKFFQHFVYIADAMKNRGNKSYSMWCEKDGFFYDALVRADGTFSHFPLRSLVGLIPLFAVDIVTEEELEKFPLVKQDFLWFLKNRKDLIKDCVTPITQDGKKKYLLSLVGEKNLGRILHYVWSPDEFRSEFGLRSLSKFHEKHPFIYKSIQVGYEPGDSFTRLKGGNSNWRGPIWFPTTYLLIQSLKKFSEAFGSTLEIYAENEPSILLKQLAPEFANKMISLFKKGPSNTRPFQGDHPLVSTDPLFKDLILFYEFYNGDTGRGLGASHQTGWSGLVANLIQEFR